MTHAATPPPATGATRRDSRRYAERELSQHRYGETSDLEEFRVDLERIRFSSYFGRLSDVTQVVPQSGVGPVMHNRLTHSLKVSAVARVIAANLAAHIAAHEAWQRGESATPDATGAALQRLGGCDTVVVQAAAHAHDLGHPPFGHLGERVLDHIAREQWGLAEGFEGNAQSFRIITSLDTLGRDFPGLNLTAATRAAVLKYPWTRQQWSGVSLSECPPELRPRGVGNDPAAGAAKFSAYALETTELEQALAAFPTVNPFTQTVECAVMDLADDIAYAVHDLDDFARAGVLQQAAVAAELNAWLEQTCAFAQTDAAQLAHDWRTPGVSLERAWRRAQRKDAWITNADAFRAAVSRVRDEVTGALLHAPYDGGIASERAISGFTRRWIERLRSAVIVCEQPHTRGGYVQLRPDMWHEVLVLKFIHTHFVLDRPELGQPQRGMGQVVAELATAFSAWMDDRSDVYRLPRRLVEWSEDATHNYRQLIQDRPECFTPETVPADASRFGKARAILDYVASFTDQQAVSTHRTLSGGDLRG